MTMTSRAERVVTLGPRYVGASPAIGASRPGSGSSGSSPFLLLTTFFDFVSARKLLALILEQRISVMTEVELMADFHAARSNYKDL